MKRCAILASLFLLLFSLLAFANNQSIVNEIPVKADVGPYAAVIPQKLMFETTKGCWLIPLEDEWFEVEPEMSFGHFSGNPDQRSRIQDSNCFLVETNCAVNIIFDGTPLTHLDGSTTLPTTYWAFRSLGVNDIPITFPRFPLLPPFVPLQLIPAQEIGYFGDSSDIPKGPDFDIKPDWLDLILEIVTGIIWPTPEKVESRQVYTGINEKGVYAFQVFGFAGVRENISAMKAGDYVGEIRLTVSAES